MNIHSVPMLISGILCTVLAVVTWLFRRREHINRMFSLYTLALALDAFGFFFWFQFGSLKNIHFWMRITFTAGFIVPVGLILFFFAFTGYDKMKDAKVYGIRCKLFKDVTLLFIFISLLLGQFTDLMLKIPDEPEHIWDMGFGPLGQLMFPIFTLIFAYLFTMAYKSYKAADNRSQKRFILLLSVGTLMWLLLGYSGAIVLPISSEDWQFVSYIGTAIMAIFFFVAIVNYQSDKVYELNLSLEQKVKDRTRALKQKNSELEETLATLKQIQKQVIVQEKMATLGQLVGGLTHEMNTPISAIRSMNQTKTTAISKLESAILRGADHGKDIETINRPLRAIKNANRLIDQGAERLHEIIANLKNFARLDEAEIKTANINEGIESVLALIQHDLLLKINVIKNFEQIPSIVCDPRKLNQVFLNIIKNACQAIEGEGEITISTKQVNGFIEIEIKDTGRGIAPERLDTIFDPNFVTKDSKVRASLGLSICYQIVQEHHGRIEVESELGNGSVFTVILPTDNK